MDKREKSSECSVFGDMFRTNACNALGSILSAKMAIRRMREKGLPPCAADEIEQVLEDCYDFVDRSLWNVSYWMKVPYRREGRPVWTDDSEVDPLDS